VEDFDKEYYNVLELNRMAAEEAATYNEEQGHSNQENPLVKVLSVEMLRDGSQKVVLTYALQDTQTFTDFFGTTLFYGTIAQAGTQGLLLPNSMYDTANPSKVLSQSELMELGSWHMIITEGKENVLPPKSAKYLNLGALHRQDGSVVPDATGGKTYIIFK
jgi:hypothetical protein